MTTTKSTPQKPENSFALPNWARNWKFFHPSASRLATYLYNTSAYNEAHILYSEYLPIRQALGDSEGEDFVLNQLGLIHKLRGELDIALGYYEKSLALSRDRAIRR